MKSRSLAEIMSRLLIFGPGYSAKRIAAVVEARGGEVELIDRAVFADQARVLSAIRAATHILSSVPPGEAGDPVLAAYGEAMAVAPARWLGYLSSTGVYAGSEGAWIDESASLGGRRTQRVKADLAWQALRGDVSIFRLPGIYGRGRCVLDKLRDGTQHRIDAAHHVFSRIHIEDLARGVVASFAGPPGVYNLADDCPASQRAVVEAGAALLGIAPPPLEPLESAKLSPMGRTFYADCRRISNRKAKRMLGWEPQYRDYLAGLRACL